MPAQPACSRAFLLLLLSLVVAGLAAAQTPEPPGSQIVDVTVHSPGLEHNLLGDSADQKVSIVLPAAYAQDSGRRFPVLYFLHGYSDPTPRHQAAALFRDDLDRLIAAGRAEPFIIVLPNGVNKYRGSFYVNSSTMGNWEDYIVRDVVGYVDAHYRTLADPAHRVIAGHSMGGFGALTLAFRHPDVFSFVYAMSPCCTDLVGDLGPSNFAWRQIAALQSPDDVPAALAKAQFFVAANAAMDAALAPGSNNVIPVSAVDAGNYHCPYPDPGEEYPHINTQLFNTINGGDESPWNLPNPLPSPAPMTGFVRDYIENFKASEFPGKDPTYDDYRQIMQSYTPEAVPVLSQLATNFAVFDHWYCAVPSQTWCNRAFWNAGTSGGMVINPTIWTSVAWEQAGAQPTLFNQIHESGESSPLDWHVYTDETIMSLHLSLTGAIHAKALDDFHGPLFRKFFPLTPDFFTDCANGNLPAYSFLEPKFTTPHNDMHPSTPGGLYAEGQVGSVLLGELLVQQVYEAIRTSNTQKPGANNSQNTLLIITFDEHGGCYDHVDPPRGITPPDLSKFNKQDNFDFTRLGIRVPMIMVSAHIAKNTVVNTPMYHDSFLKTMEKKWNALLPGKFPYLSKRIEAAPEFTEVFTLATPRPASDWVVIDPPKIPPMKRDDPNAPLNPLDRTIVAAALAHQTPAVPQARSLSITAADTVNTVGEAEALLRAAGRTEADI